MKACENVVLYSFFLESPGFAYVSLFHFLFLVRAVARSVVPEAASVSIWSDPVSVLAVNQLGEMLSSWSSSKAVRAEGL